MSIPKYKTVGISCAIVNDSKEPTPKTPEDYKNWLESLKPKSDFNKQMLEADKELQRVCKNIEIDCKCLGQDFIQEIVEFEFNAKSCRQKKCFSCGKITVMHRYNT